MVRLTFLLFLIQLCVVIDIHAQEPTTTNWDNQMYLSNKISWGNSENWRQSGELQTRFREDLAALEQWHLEYVASYLLSEHIELVPDFRITRKPDRMEYRPGIGVIFKSKIGKSHVIHQVKWQYDFKGNGMNDSQGLRYVIFYNYQFSEKLIGSFLVGGLFEYGNDFSGFLGLRTGPTIAYILDKQHSLNVGYYYGLINRKNETTSWRNVGIINIQLIINFRKEFKYLPAKYFSF